MSPGSASRASPAPDIKARVISLGKGLPAIPERLLLAHAQGKVLFIAGAGVSMAAGLPDFRKLVLDVYAKLDKTVSAVLNTIPSGACNRWHPNTSNLSDAQTAEVKRFIVGDYDVVLGMLERRLDGESHRDSSVRTAIEDILRNSTSGPAAIHRAIMRLADRGGALSIVTTNFEHLLEAAVPKKTIVQSYTLGGIPRPTQRLEFSGVMHIHGMLDPDPTRASDFIVSDRDFGEFYLRRRIVPDFIYDAARLFHLVLVGYSANDAPMRYLLNAVAADGSRFEDLRERFTFVGASVVDNVAQEDWRGRGITPIHYDSANYHASLRETMERWADLSPRNGKKGLVESEIRRIVSKSRNAADVADRDLFDHFIRRADANERDHLVKVASQHGAELGWLDATTQIIYEEASRRP